MSKVYIKEVGAIRVTPLPANLIHTSATSFIFLVLLWLMNYGSFDLHIQKMNTFKSICFYCSVIDHSNFGHVVNVATLNCIFKTRLSMVDGLLVESWLEMHNIFLWHFFVFYYIFFLMGKYQSFFERIKNQICLIIKTMQCPDRDLHWQC